MPEQQGCRIDESCPEFTRLRDHYRKNGFPHVDEDVQEAYKHIRQNVSACRGSRMMGFDDVLPAGTWLMKYRQKSRDIKRGASYGWRIIANFFPDSRVLYPLILYPKTHMGECDHQALRETLQELKGVLAKNSN